MVVGRVAVPSNLFHTPSSAATLIPPHTRLLSFSASAAASSSSSANHTRDTPTTNNDSPFSTFGKLKAQKLKTVLHRSKERRRVLQVEEEDDNDDDDENHASPRARPSQSRSRSRSGGREQGGWDMIPRFPSQAKSTTDTNFFSLKSFKEIGCADYIIQSLQKIFLTRPSHVQAMAFTPVLSGKTCVIADQSGSGKTLAYLAPIIQRLRQEELEGRSKSSSQAPRVLVLAPTAELASQVLDNCRSLSKSGLPFKSMVITGGFRQRTQLENLQQGVDVLIATPGRFLYLMNEGFLQLTNLRW